MNEKDLINFIEEIFEDVEEIELIYKIMIMNNGKIKIQYKHKNYNFLCESIFKKNY